MAAVVKTDQAITRFNDFLPFDCRLVALCEFPEGSFLSNLCYKIDGVSFAIITCYSSIILSSLKCEKELKFIYQGGLCKNLLLKKDYFCTGTSVFYPEEALTEILKTTKIRIKLPTEAEIKQIINAIFTEKTAHFNICCSREYFLGRI
jgi:hypothetical protein